VHHEHELAALAGPRDSVWVARVYDDRFRRPYGFRIGRAGLVAEDRKVRARARAYLSTERQFERPRTSRGIESTDAPARRRAERSRPYGYGIQRDLSERPTLAWRDEWRLSRQIAVGAEPRCG
jgi:hypothetical protein